MTSSSHLPGHINKNHITIEIPLPGYHDVIASDLCMTSSHHDVTSSQSNKEQPRRERDVEVWRQLNTWTRTSGSDDHKKGLCRSYCVTATVVLILLYFIFVALTSLTQINK